MYSENQMFRGKVIMLVISTGQYSRAHLIRTADARKNHANYQSLFYVTFL